MMDKKLKGLSGIISGNMGVAEAQEILSTLSKEETSDLMDKGNLESLLPSYRKRNNSPPHTHPMVTEKEIDHIWCRIMDAVEKDKKTVSSRLGEMLFLFFGRAARAFSPSGLRKMAMSVCAVLVIVSVTVMVERQHPSGMDTIWMKGDNATLDAMLQYAIVGRDGALLRPARRLRQADTIAFRLTFAKDGYGSLYVVYDGRKDTILSDRFFHKGENDLDVGYRLTGNRGTNEFILFFSTAPLNLDAHATGQMIIDAARQGASSLNVEDHAVSLFYEKFVVE